MNRYIQASALLGSVALIIGATLLPFGGGAAESVPSPWCLRCGTLWLTDFISNVALFAPFGAALSLRRLGMTRLVLASFLCSAAIELLQYLGLPPGRSPALADIISNTLGGAVGALAVWAARAERDRTAEHASVLAVAWGLFATLVFALTSLALQPPATLLRGPFLLADSPFEHVPGHGWYEGVTDSARVGAEQVKRGWSGPIIRQVSRAQLPVSASVWVKRTDPLRGQIPLLFLHLPNDSSAWLQIAKHGDDAELTVYRRAWRVGLTMPSVRVAKAFDARTIADTSTLGVHADVTNAALALRTSGVVTDSAVLSLSPLLGWALIQPVISVQSPVAPLTAFGWSVFLLAPIAWWCARPRVRIGLLVVVSGGIACVLVLLPSAMGVHPLSVREWIMLAAGLGSGAIVARRRQYRHLPESKAE